MVQKTKETKETMQKETMQKETIRKETMRLDKFLTEMGMGSRSQMKEAARRGKIAVNGTVCKNPETKITPQTDAVLFDGQPVSYVKLEYYMLYKPQGVVSATEDNRYPTVLDLIAEKKRKDLFPVGRLDLDTEGLLLITNDGGLAHRLLAPRKHVDKVYEAWVEGTLPSDAGLRFAEGITLTDGTKTRPANLEILEIQTADKHTQSHIHLTIHEGKFHQVKRMFEALGCHVVYLKRLSMGSLVLDAALKPGEYRPLTEKEVEALHTLGVLSEKSENPKERNPEEENIKEESIKEETVKKESIKKEIVKKGTVKKESIKKEIVKKETIKKETIKKETEKNEAIKKKKAETGARDKNGRRTRDEASERKESGHF